MIKKATALRHSPPEEDASLKSKEFCRDRRDSNKNIPSIRQVSRDSGLGFSLSEDHPTVDRDTGAQNSLDAGFPTGFGDAYHKLYLKKKNYSSPAVASEALDSLTPQELSPLPSFHIISGSHSTGPQTMRDENMAPQLSPKFVYDNMVIGHFMPHCFTRQDAVEKNSAREDASFYPKLDDPESLQSNIIQSSKVAFNFRPTMHLDLLPSPPNSTNSPSEASYQNLCSERNDASPHPFGFQGVNLSSYHNTQETQAVRGMMDTSQSNSIVERSSQISLDVTPSGCTLLSSRTPNDSVNDVRNNNLRTGDVFTANQFCDMITETNQFSTNRTDSSTQTIQSSSDFQCPMPSVFMSPHEPSFPTDVIQQTFGNVSQSNIPDHVTHMMSEHSSKNNPQVAKPSSALGRYFILPHIPTNTGSEGDNISLISYASNNGAQSGSSWYPSYSPYGNDSQGYTNCSRQSGASSFSGRGSRNKRALSNSPLSAEGIDINSIIRMSPTSLFTYITGSKCSSSCISPGSTVEKGGCYGHLSARNSSSSPHSGSVSSATQASVAQTPKLLDDGSGTFFFKNDFSDSDNSLLILQAMQELEAGCSTNMISSSEDASSMMVPDCDNLRILPQDVATYKMDEYYPFVTAPELPPNTYFQSPLPNMPPEAPCPVLKTLPPLPNKPPPTYDQHMARKATLQKKNSSDSSQPSNSSSFESTESDKTGAGASSSTDTEQNRLYDCQWHECKAVFQDQEEFVTHIEKMHIDQRKGEEFSCLWRSCIRKAPFNARYKLLMHMRVHSGEKPNRCTVVKRPFPVWRISRSTSDRIQGNDHIPVYTKVVPKHLATLRIGPNIRKPTKI